MVRILEAKQLTEQALLAIPGVQGVGVTAFSPKEKIRVYVEKLTSKIREKVPKKIAGFPVELIQSGRFKALSLMAPIKLATEAVRTSRLRPALGGVSIGHVNVTAGTLGGVIGGLILSNNHVLADNNMASIGDLILQPGRVDPGADEIATLHSFVPLNPRGPNFVDMAWARPLSPDLVSAEILGVGFINGLVAPRVNMDVQKSGRTTAVTTGKIVDVNATVTVDYEIFTLTFSDQVVTSFMMEPGDSGSLGLDMNNNLWGLGFAGSNELSLYNKIGNVFGASPVAPFAVGNVFPLLIGGLLVSHFLFGFP